MRAPQDTLRLSDGTQVDWTGPATPDVSRVLTKAGFERVRDSWPKPEVTPGQFHSSKPRGAAYVEVRCCPSQAAEQRAVLELSGSLVTRDATPVSDASYIVFAMPRLAGSRR